MFFPICWINFIIEQDFIFLCFFAACSCYRGCNVVTELNPAHQNVLQINVWGSLPVVAKPVTNENLWLNLFIVNLQWPTDMYLFKVNIGNRTMCEIYSKVTIRTLEQRQDVICIFIVISERILHITLVYPLLTWNK